jgi:ribonuclease HII
MITVGIDEVGRGCWAGPLVAAAVALKNPLNGVKDSKKLTRNSRSLLSDIVMSEAIAYGIGWVTASEVDQLGLTESVRRAMYRALEQITIDYDEVIIDGNYNFLAANNKTRTIIRADASVPAVSAASIIAKVARDNFMIKAAKEHQDYGFEKHVGYGTKLHIEKLHTYGVSSLHRRSVKPIKALLQYAP